MYKRTFVLSACAATALLTACTTTSSTGGDVVEKRRSINAAVDSALSKLYAQVPGSWEMVAKSKGLLVFPSVVSAGLGVGGSYGQGELRTGARTVGYYSTTGVSVGLMAGADSKSVFILFMNQESLDKFVASSGWTAGVDASVTMIQVGANIDADTQTMKKPVVGYALNNGGLMASLSLDGTKTSKLDL